MIDRYRETVNPSLERLPAQADVRFYPIFSLTLSDKAEAVLFADTVFICLSMQKIDGISVAFIQKKD